jgi:palmitoyltransferase ZDHHC9/14/18
MRSSLPRNRPPDSPGDPTEQAVKTELAKNYQYFSGNTAFCWGGRLQNTRDRPVNIATAIMIVLPAALFFGYSYVYSLLTLPAA